MFTPTVKELEKIGFWNSEDFPSIYIYIPEECEKFDNRITYSFVTKYFYIWSSFIYPNSLQDIKDLISLFTPH